MVIGSAAAATPQSKVDAGTVVIAVVVNEQGRVDECRIVTPSGQSDLDEKTCNIAMKRFKAKPKLVDGRPVSSSLTLPVHWTQQAAAVP